MLGNPVRQEATRDDILCHKGHHFSKNASLRTTSREVKIIIMTEGVEEQNLNERERTLAALREAKVMLENTSAALKLDAELDEIMKLAVKDPSVLEELKKAVKEHPDVRMYNAIRRVFIRS